VDVADVTRYARHISLPEIGPEGQARISAARVAVVGADLAAETAATYLRAAGCQVVEETLSVAEIDLIVRSGFDDTPLDAEAARLGLPFIAVRATPEAVDMVAFSGRVPSPEAPEDIEAILARLDRALNELSASFPRSAQVVQLRFLAGMTTEEAAAELGLSAGTVKREWTFARAWLAAAIESPPGPVP